MKLENEFTVPAPLDQAWQVLLDVERVAPCLPGAAIEGADGDAHKGTMTIKIGPITTPYSGAGKIEGGDAGGGGGSRERGQEKEKAGPDHPPRRGGGEEGGGGGGGARGGHARAGARQP